MIFRTLSALLVLSVFTHAAEPQRLDRKVEPLSQAVTLDLDPAQDRYRGSAEIELLIHEPVQAIRFHAAEIDLANAALISGTTITKITLKAGDFDVVTASTGATIPAGSHTLRVEFANEFQRDGTGLYKAVYQGRAYLFTQMEARYARKAFPCWDEPEFKIPWRITATLPADAEIVGNMSPADVAVKDGRKTVQLGRTPPMPSYLVALFAGPLESVPVSGMSVPGRIVTASGQTALAGEIAARSGPLLHALEDYFGVPYPYPKLDQVALPEFLFGGMENPGAIAYNDAAVLLPATGASFEQKRGLSVLVAHEMAHLWFGDLVTMRWWDDLWLNESFADWMAMKTVERVYPEFRQNLANLGHTHGAMHTDAQRSVTPIRRTLGADDDPTLLLDELTYNKGKAVLQMIEGWIGAEAFRTAMRGYFEKHRWGSTDAADLWTALDVTGGGVRAIAESFIAQPGIPLLTCEVLPGDKLRISQRRFSNLSAPAPQAVQWQIPVVLRYGVDGKAQTARLLLTGSSQTLDLPGISRAEWLYPNAEERGYYRWSVAPELARRAIAALTPAERLGFLDNTAALLDGGQIHGDECLRAIASFATDPEPEIAGSVCDMLDGLGKTFIEKSERPRYAAFLRRLLRPALDRIGITPRDGEPPHASILRSRLITRLGLDGDDADVLAFAREQAAREIATPGSVDSALVSPALKVAAWHGDDALFASLRAAFEKAKTPVHRRNFRRALGGFRDPAIAQKALAYSLGDALNPTEFLSVAQRLAETPELAPAVFQWVEEHYAAIHKKAPAEDLGYLPWIVATTDLATLEKARTFFLAPARRSQLAAKEIEKVADTLTQRVRLAERERASVLAFLADEKQ